MRLRTTAWFACVLCAAGCGATEQRADAPPPAERAQQAGEVAPAESPQQAASDPRGEDAPAPEADDRCGAIPACAALRAAIEADDVAPLAGHVTEPFYVAGAGIEGGAVADLDALRAAVQQAGGLRALLGLPLSGEVRATLTRDCARCAAERYDLRLEVGERAVELRTRGRERVFRIDVVR